MPTLPQHETKPSVNHYYHQICHYLITPVKWAQYYIPENNINKNY